ncbi:MAG: hypothetical protein M3301_04585 [Chloroflexota bacterium]|nr:hypothetical protein [Chloroflexota bacterium]
MSPEEEALQSDAYLDYLLAAHGHAPRPVPAGELASLDEELREAADVLETVLVRFHPSFRFEESLAARLRAAAGAATVPAAPGSTIPFPRRPAPAIVDPREVVNRGLLVGGAIASGVSLAGAAAWFAWRRRARQEPLA